MGQLPSLESNDFHWSSDIMNRAKLLILGFSVILSAVLCLRLYEHGSRDLKSGPPKAPAIASISSGREYLLWSNDRPQPVELSRAAKTGTMAPSSAAVLADIRTFDPQMDASFAFANCQANDMSNLLPHANFSCVPEPGPMSYLLGFVALGSVGIVWRTLRARFAIVLGALAVQFRIKN